jgi:predicted DNA-binding ribbon-helix-helix protein
MSAEENKAIVSTMRLEPALHAALQEAAQRQHVSLNQLVETYCTQWLALDGVRPLEGQAMSALRTLLEEIIERHVEQRMDATAARLARLTTRSLRHAALAHRFLYHCVAQNDRARAAAIETAAARDTT